MTTGPFNRISWYAMQEEEGLEELREKMVRELELDLSYALGREGRITQAWGMKHVSCAQKSGTSGLTTAAPSP
jgi:hypothetical protein